MVYLRIVAHIRMTGTVHVYFCWAISDYAILTNAPDRRRNCRDVLIIVFYTIKDPEYMLILPTQRLAASRALGTMAMSWN